MSDQRSTRSNGRYKTGEPSVTTIIGSVLAKPALTHWLQKKTFYAALEGAKTFSEAQRAVRNISKKAMDTGTRVHKYIEDYKQGKTQQMDDDLVGFYKAFHHFFVDYSPTFIHREVTVTSKQYGYKGTLDLIAEIEGERCLIDIKTGKKIYKDSVSLQASAYKQAYIEQTGQEVDKMYCLLLEKDSSGQSTEKYVFEELKDCFPIFESTLKIYNWQNGSK